MLHNKVFGTVMMVTAGSGIFSGTYYTTAIGGVKRDDSILYRNTARYYMVNSASHICWFAGGAAVGVFGWPVGIPILAGHKIKQYYKNTTHNDEF
jgi:hypothetical protein